MGHKEVKKLVREEESEAIYRQTGSWKKAENGSTPALSYDALRTPIPEVSARGNWERCHRSTE
jgi:hypothetical protein